MSIEQTIRELENRLAGTQTAIETIDRARHMLSLALRSLERRDNPDLRTSERIKALEQSKTRLGVTDPGIGYANFPWSKGNFHRPVEALFSSRFLLTNGPPSGTIYMFPGGQAVTPDATPEDIVHYTGAYTEVLQKLTGEPQDIEFLIAVYNGFSEQERRLVTFALNENPRFCHPHLYESAEHLFLDRITRRHSDQERIARTPSEIVQNFAGLAFVGYSYGASAIIQQLNYAQRLMQDYGVDHETQHRALSKILAVFIAPDSIVYRPDHLPITRITVASPLDERITGFLTGEYPGEDDLSLAWESLSPENIEPMVSGQWQRIVAPHFPERLDERTFFATTLLPGRIQFDAEGQRIPEFVTRGGHRLIPYIEATIRQYPAIGKTLAEFSRNKDAMCEMNLDECLVNHARGHIGRYLK